jgi:hypothetical protein
LKPSSTTTGAPGQLLGELFGPLPGDNKIRDPRAGQGLVETAIRATKAVSQLMGSVLQVRQATALLFSFYICIIQLHERVTCFHLASNLVSVMFPLIKYYFIFIPHLLVLL